ncbi:hypothetical protein OIU77_021288 [Salix suchowensis]|uniref:DUF4283 domain-containing protein n=1 Tax=Salix suchowensis TaxID=1278906 RepID=A0ABQ9CCB1_9ROSI|nr:hypothetical protein OIU77_021288 [Salix suchowensis]
MSFKDKVSADFGKAEDNMVFGDEDYIIQHGEVPSIQFSDKIKECLYRPWKSAIIIKLIGMPLNFYFLRDRLLRRWQLKGPMTLIDLENNFFIVKFLLEEDMKHVLTGGPWQVVGQYVTTQRWKPGFDPKEEKITHMTAWDNCPLKENAKIQASEAAEAETMKNVTGLDKSTVEIENLEATQTDQMPRAAVNAGINVIEENPPNLHGQWMLLKRKKIKKKFIAEVGKVHVEPKEQLSTRSRFTVLEADGNRGVASKDANYNSLTGVKKAIHNSSPKKKFW